MREKNQLLSDLILLMNSTFDFSKVDNYKVAYFIEQIDSCLLRECLDCMKEILDSIENINAATISKLFTVIAQDNNLFDKFRTSKYKKNILLDVLRNEL